MLPSLARKFVRLDPPRFVVPRSGKKTGARIAQNFTTFIEGITSGYNASAGTSLTPAEGLRMILDANVDPVTLFAEYRGFAEQLRTHVVLREWSQEKYFDEGWKWMTGDFAKWFVWHVLGRPYSIDESHRFEGAPALRKVLIEHPNGERWMIAFTLTLRDFLYPNHGDVSEPTLTKEMSPAETPKDK